MENLLLTPVKLDIAIKLQEKTFRDSFFATKLRDDIAIQLRELRELRGLTQVESSAWSGKALNNISFIERALTYNWTINTMLKLTQTLDAHIEISLVTKEEAIKRYEERESK